MDVPQDVVDLAVEQLSLSANCRGSSPSRITGIHCLSITANIISTLEFDDRRKMVL